MPTAAECEYLVRFSEPPSTWYYISSTHGRSTTSGDTPASTYVSPGSPDLSFNVTLFADVDPEAPRAEGGCDTPAKSRQPHSTSSLRPSS